MAKQALLRRAEQLRIAKQKQRERDRTAGLQTLELRLPVELASRLRAASKATSFVSTLDNFLNHYLIETAKLPGLSELTWNRTDRWIPADEALALYERNWRFIDPEQLSSNERKLIDHLQQNFGAGILHV